MAKVIGELSLDLRLETLSLMESRSPSVMLCRFIGVLSIRQNLDGRRHQVVTLEKKVSNPTFSNIYFRSTLMHLSRCQ